MIIKEMNSMYEMDHMNEEGYMNEMHYDYEGEMPVKKAPKEMPSGDRQATPEEMEAKWKQIMRDAMAGDPHAVQMLMDYGE